MKTSADLTICTTVTGSYVRFLGEWAASLAALAVPPARVVIVSNGIARKARPVLHAALARTGCPGDVLVVDRVPCGRARNLAIAAVATPWACHLDADDVLLPDALAQVAEIADGADVVSLGYRRWSPGNKHGYPGTVLYESLDGVEALGSVPRIASGCSPFRKDFWSRWRYVECLEASFDYSLWLGLATLGARFRPTKKPAFLYRQHEGSLWRRLGRHRHADLLAVRRLLEAQGVDGAREHLGALGRQALVEYGGL